MNNKQKQQEKTSFSGVYFSWIIIALIVFSSVVSTKFSSEEVKNAEWYQFLSYALSGLVILFTTVLLCLYTKNPIEESCKLNKAEKKYYIYAILLSISAIFGIGGINGLFAEFLIKNFGYSPTPIVLPEFSWGKYLLVLLTLCFIPAVAEEIAFRGILLRDVKSGNIYVNALIGGLFFSLFHMNPAQTPYQFVMGFFFSLIALKSKSVFPVMVAHFINNAFIVTAEYFFPNYLSNTTVFIVLTVFGLLFFALFVFLIVREKTEEQEKGDLKTFFISSIVGILFCLLIWIAGFLG